MESVKPLQSVAVVAFLAFGMAGCLSEDQRGPDMADAVVAGPEEGTKGAAPAWPSLEDARIRPGVRITWNGPPGELLRLAGCTANFVFASPDNATLYLGTAAHCVDGYEVGDEVVIAEGLATGALAYCSFLAGGAPTCHTEPTYGDRNDFALVELKPEDRPLVHPSVLHWPGPTGLAACSASEPGSAIVAYGNSSYRTVLDPTKPLSGEVIENFGDGNVLVRFDTPGIPADSGSPVLTADGQAFGLVRALNPDGTNGVSCMDALLESEAERGGPPVALATWEG